MVTLLAALEDAWGRGDRRFDLGGGDQPYKYRFAEADETLEWWTLAPRGRRYPLVRTVLFPQHAYRWAARHVPEGWRGAAKKLVPRAPSWAR